MIVGEASGDNEKRDGLPFRPYAQAGSVLERALANQRVSRRDLSITNLCRCQPPNNLLEKMPYEIVAITHCSQYLDKEVEKYKPNCLIALGGLALKYLTGMVGKKKTVSILRGYVLWSQRYQLPVVPSYHPSFIARGNKELLGVLGEDIKLALDVAQGRAVRGERYVIDPFEEYTNDYILNPSPLEFSHLVSDALSRVDTLVAYDIETSESIKTEDEEEIDSSVDKITQFQFSQGKRRGVVVPWSDEYIPDIRRLMGGPNRKLSWNGWRFDKPILNRADVRIEGEDWDLMTLWHWYQGDLPAGLQYSASFFSFPFPWKHYSSEHPEFYGAVDVDSLWWIYEPLLKRCKELGIMGL